MKNLLSKRLSKRDILIFFLFNIVVLISLVLLNQIREKVEFDRMANEERAEFERTANEEKAELERIMNMNNNVTPETYDFDMSERPEEIGDIKIEYVEEEEGSSHYGLAEIAYINLPDASKAYSINVVLQPGAEPEQHCRIFMDHPDYEILVIAYDKCTVSVFPSGEIRISSDDEMQDVFVEYKRKNEDSLFESQISFYSQILRDFKVYPLYPYRNDLVLEADNLRYTSMRYEPGQYSYGFADKYTNHDKWTKRALITKNKSGETFALVDTDNDGIFDTNIVGRNSTIDN